MFDLDTARRAFQVFTHGVYGDKNKGFQRDFPCVYFLCPSNPGDENLDKRRPSKNKFVQKIAPSVYQYRCSYCGCLMNVSVEIAENGRECFRVNPALIGGKPSYELGGFKW